MDQITRGYSVPDHVPADLVVDVDMYDIPGGREDAQGAWRELRTRGPLSWSPRNGGHWIATTGDAVFELLRDAKHFSSEYVAIPKIEGKIRMAPIEMDPPEHAAYRKTIMPLFTSDAVDALGEQARALCVELIEEFRGSGQCEFIQDFAFKFPLGIFLKMMGLPDEDRMYLRDLVERFVTSPDLDVKIAMEAELHAYIDRALDARVASPRDDATTMILNATFEGRPYTRDEMKGTIILLLFAGLDTVAGFLSFITLHLAQRPDHAAYIRTQIGDETAMHNVAQELLRRFAIANLGRIMGVDYEYHGVQMKKGDMVLLPTSIFNMDPERIGNPDAVDFQRASTRHVTFGSGPHTCAGALLARKEIRIFLEEWLARIPEFRLDPAHPPVARALPLNQVMTLPLRWDV
jgi:cytochrome P450